MSRRFGVRIPEGVLMTEFPKYSEMKESQQRAIDRTLQDAARTAEAQSNGESFYKLYYLEIEEFRYDEEKDELVPTGVFLARNNK